MGVRRTGYPQELLAAADSLLNVEPHTEALTRRSISTAYDALFHLLIEYACELWSVPEHRARISRNFDHNLMRDISSGFSKRDKEDQNVVLIASTFVQLQQDRHKADYKLSEEVSREKAEQSVVFARNAFEAWDIARDTPLAKEYLLSMLFRKSDS